MLRILTRICEGDAAAGDLALLERLAKAVAATAACGLGTMAPNPVLVALEHFRDEFKTHVANKECPAGVCRFARADRLERALVKG